MRGITNDRVIDFGPISEDHPSILVSIARKLSVATRSAFDDIQKLLGGYLKCEWRTVTALAGTSRDSLAGLFIVTPLTTEAFISVMSGRYQFPYQGNGVYLPRTEDVIPYAKSEVILIAGLGYADPNDRDIKDMIYQVRGSFLLQFAWKRRFEIVCVTERGQGLDQRVRKIMFPSPTIFEDHRDYRTHETTFGPMRGQKK